MLPAETKLNTILTKISQQKFKRQFIEVEVISPSTSVVISNIDKKRDKDFLEVYFGNHRLSGVSGYKDLEIKGDGQVIIHLHDQKSMFFIYEKYHHNLIINY